jgi:hypothetical protein
MRSAQISFAEPFGERANQSATRPMLHRSIVTAQRNINEETKHNA